MATVKHENRDAMVDGLTLALQGPVVPTRCTPTKMHFRFCCSPKSIKLPMFHQPFARLAMSLAVSRLMSGQHAMKISVPCTVPIT